MWDCSKKTLTLNAILWPLIFELIIGQAEAAKVLDIGDQLPELIEKHPYKTWLVKFYAPWCYHCQQLGKL